MLSRKLAKRNLVVLGGSVLAGSGDISESAPSVK